MKKIILIILGVFFIVIFFNKPNNVNADELINSYGNLEVKKEPISFLQMGNIRIRYLDQETKEEIISSDTISGVIGRNASAKILQKINEYADKMKKLHYELDTIYDADIDYSYLTQTVVITYKKVKKAIVWVKYVDEDTRKEISTPQILYGWIGERYDVTSKRYQPTIGGYNLDRTKLPNNRKGVFNQEKIIVVYNYKLRR